MWALMNDFYYWLNVNFSCLSDSWLNMRHSGKPDLKTMSPNYDFSIITFCMKIIQN